MPQVPKKDGWIELPAEPEGVLPELYADVLVWCDLVDWEEDGDFQPFIAHRETNGWVSLDRHVRHHRITHWCPLPDTP